MFLTVLKKEMLEQVFSFRFFVLTAICLILIPLSLFVSNREYLNRITDHNRLVQMSRERIENTQMMELMSEAYSVDGYAPPVPLSVFAGGLTGSAPDGFQSRRAGIEFTSSTGTDDVVMDLTGKIDYLIIVQIIFSLLAIVFTFDAVCGEREQGTLKILLSNAIPRDTVIFGKLLGILVTMIIPFAVAFIISLVMLVFLGFPLAGGDTAFRLAGMFGATIAFIAVFACIGLVVSSRVERSKTAVVVLLFVWIMIINVIPKGAGIAAQAFMPVESEAVVDIEKSMLRRNFEMDRGAEIARMESTLPQYLEITSENNERNSAINDERSRLLADIREEYVRKINDGLQQIDLRVRAKRDGQNLATRLISQFSPITSFTNIVTTIAGTGVYDRERFITAVGAYQETVYQALFRHIHRDITSEGHMTMSIDGDMIDLENLPEFIYTRPSLSETWGAVMLDMVILALFLITTFAAVYVSFLRYDVR